MTKNKYNNIQRRAKFASMFLNGIIDYKTYNLVIEYFKLIG